MKNNTQYAHLQRKNNSINTKLIHNQIQSKNYTFKYYKKYSSLIIKEYKQHKSLFKASQIIGIDYNIVINWYVQGQLNNPKFRGFYLLINEINQNSNTKSETKNPTQIEQKPEIPEDKYVLSEYGDGWSYKTYIDGEKIFIISNELETLKKKIKKKQFPLD